MEGWVQQRQSGISFDELTSMVAELMASFERHGSTNAQYDANWSPDWVSPSSMTRVIRHGSSASLHSVLQQTPDTISAEYEVIHRGLCVFNWCEYLWPQLRQAQPDMHHGMLFLPQDCLVELMDFHVYNSTQWLSRFQRKQLADRAIEIDKVRVMAQTNCIEIG